ncbi:DNA-directed RNA polymerase subunit beta [Solibacillus sp. FSL H8-0538]|uniref:DNA-directed RNA polymerase subunit beta n=1 Tax=Solibacillus sp. FSL H8-0538 TaxID=2921400 RepID=UPI0030F67B38
MTNELKGNEPQSEHENLEPKKKRSRAQEPSDKPTRWVQLRLIPIWLRIILVAVLFIVSAAIGMIVGYGYIGDGDPGDALKWSTWQHLLDIIEGIE